jgi:P27 family predicted phage terminase small subunit
LADFLEIRFYGKVAASEAKQEGTMSGPPPTPLHLRRLRGNRGRRALRAEPEPAALPEAPEPPVFLIGHAADEWHRVAGELHALGVLRGIDVQLLAAYCTSYATWRTAIEALATMAAKDPITHGLLVWTTDGNPRRNPLAKIAADAAQEMLRFAASFGIGAAARSRIAAGWQPPERARSKFEGLLA